MKKTFWLAEAQSSQRDMLLCLQGLKPHHDIHLIASHRHHRPEITDMADEHVVEANDDTRLPTIVDQAIQRKVSVLLTGRNGKQYESYRPRLSDSGVVLLTGANDAHTLSVIDDKYTFIQHCQAHGISVTDGVLVQNFDELCRAIDDYQDIPLCIKPTVGIFAQGFWILDNAHEQKSLPAIDPFYHLYHTEPKRIHTQSFLDAYEKSSLAHTTPMLVMPYLSGVEYSIDVVCDQGEILGAVTRHKVGSIQHVGYDEAVMELVIPLVRLFQCTGIISVQTKADEQGRHHVLEINPRPSGGIGYTVHSGLDLTCLAFLYFSGLSDKPTLRQSRAKITPCQVRPLMTSVKLS